TVSMTYPLSLHDALPILGSVLNEGLMEQICKQYAVNTFYHAAAYKHVPIVESNAAAGVRNNILGTFYAAQAAEKAGVERFILISDRKSTRLNSSHVSFSY